MLLAGEDAVPETEVEAEPAEKGEEEALWEAEE